MDSVTFITTTLGTKWLNYQQALIRKHFPFSKIIPISGRWNWPYAWFNWLGICNLIKSEWIALVDEDFFFFESDPLKELALFLEDGRYDVAGVSDGFHHYRQNNPVAMNSFFLMINTRSIQRIIRNVSTLERIFSFRNIQKYFKIPVVRSFDPKWLDEKYPHSMLAGSEVSSKCAEPYYPFFWTLKSEGFRFYYLFPYFDENLKSTNPRLHKSSSDIGIHMWYARNWSDKKMDVHGLTNNQRYKLIENVISRHFAEQ